MLPQKIVDPDQGLLKEEDEAAEDEFVPGESSILEAEDGGSSEEELDKEEEADNVEEELELSLDDKTDVVKGVPPAMAQAYKKRFPEFWRTHQSLTMSSGQGYNEEEDPDFEANEDSEESGEDTETESDNKDNSQDEMKEVQEEIDALTAKVEDMIIPEEEVKMAAAEAKSEDAHNDDEEDEEEEVEVAKNMAQVME